MATLLHYTKCAHDCDFRTTGRTKEHLLRHVRAGVPCVIRSSELHLLPSRHDLLSLDLVAKTTKQLAASQPVLFMPVSIADDYDNNHREIYIGYMAGVLECGRRCCVIIDNIEVHVDVGYRDRKFANYDILEAEVRDFIPAKASITTKMSRVELYPAQEFSPDKQFMCRVIFRNLAHRKEFIDTIHREIDDHHRFVISSNDLQSNNKANYLQKWARERRINTCAWNIISSYTVVPAHLCGIATCDVVLRINPADIAADLQTPEDPCIDAKWDIETYNDKLSGGVPPLSAPWEVFMINTSYYLAKSTKPQLSICAVDDRGVLACPGVSIAVQCTGEYDVLKTWIAQLARMRPDLLAGFNSGKFDWPRVLYHMKTLRDPRDPHSLPGSLLAELRAALCAFDTKPNISDIYKSLQNDPQFTRRIKISAELFHVPDVVMNWFGFIDYDVMPVFMRRYPTAEVTRSHSLASFLKRNGLDGKEDMPYDKMFAIRKRGLLLRDKSCLTVCHCDDDDKRKICKACNAYEPLIDTKPMQKCCHCEKRPQNRRDMRDVIYYCYVDCQRLQDLCDKCAITVDAREQCNLTYCGLRDSFYYANGGRICNLFGAVSFERDTAFDNRTKNGDKIDREHYEGGFVFPPNKGLHADNIIDAIKYVDGEWHRESMQGRPIAPFDFSSLYPSLSVTWNISANTCVYDAKTAQDLESRGYSLRHLPRFEYLRGGEKTKVKGRVKIRGETAACYSEVWWVQHREVKDAASDKIVERYDKDPTTNIWKPVFGRSALPREEMGIMPLTVSKLLAARKPLKARVFELEAQIAAADHLDEEKIRELHMQYAIVLAKSNAIKTVNNSIYGKTGDNTAGIYNINVAYGITKNGQLAVKAMYDYLTSLNYTIHYGDTDSLYISCPDDVYARVDAEYAAGNISRVEYWTQQVNLTHDHLPQLAGVIKDFLMHYCGNLHLAMTSEGVNFPTCFCGKKKYYARHHAERANFTSPIADKIMVKGINVVRQGQTQISKDLGYQFMYDSLSADNHLSLCELARRGIDEYFAANHTLGLFTQFMTYRSHKQNPAAHGFVERMTAAHDASETDEERQLYAPPEDGDKFQYVMVTKPTQRTFTGAKITTKKFDKMEYPKVYLASLQTDSPMAIDINSYVDSSILGLFARFVSGCPEFTQRQEYQTAMNAANYTPGDDYELIDDIGIRHSIKMLADYAMNVSGIDIASENEHGKECQRVYKYVRATCREVFFGETLKELFVATNKPLAEKRGIIAKSVEEMLAIPHNNAPIVSQNGRDITQLLADYHVRTGRKLPELRRATAAKKQSAESTINDAFALQSACDSEILRIVQFWRDDPTQQIAEIRADDKWIAATQWNIVWHMSRARVFSGIASNISQNVAAVQKMKRQQNDISVQLHKKKI